jgi:trigger factor
MRSSLKNLCLNDGVQTQVEELADNKVRLKVQVPRDDVHHAVEHAATDLAANVKIPGFRKGKVPMPVLIQRVGRERLYQEAIESHIGGWFWNAAARRRLRPVEQPQYDFDLPASDREDWEFTATVSVQAKAEVADWTSLEVPYREPEVPQDLVEHELQVLQATVAELAPVDGRSVQDGDTVVVDLVSDGGETRRDYVIELGRGAVVDEIEQGLVGMSVGESKEIQFELGDDTRQTVTLTVTEIKEKVLPPLDDELAKAATEFETLADLRTDIEARLHEQLAAESDVEFRAAVADKLVEASRVEASGPLVESRTRELLGGLARTVERRGVDFETYLTMTGTDPNELVARLRAEAAQSVARELVLEAAADKLQLEVGDEQVEQLVREQVGAGGDDPDALIQSLRESGRFEQLRDDIRLRDALDRIAGAVQRIAPEVAAARDAIWTPDKEKPETETKLWTPGSKEPA